MSWIVGENIIGAFSPRVYTHIAQWEHIAIIFYNTQHVRRMYVEWREEENMK